MRQRIVTALVTLLASTATGTLPGLSHHSHAMFDHRVEVTITGKVSTFSYRNPHVFLYLDVEGESGRVSVWAIEMSNVKNMIRRGVRASTFASGDIVTVTLNPLKNGEQGGNYLMVRAADGRIYYD